MNYFRIPEIKEIHSISKDQFINEFQNRFRSNERKYSLTNNLILDQEDMYNYSIFRLYNRTTLFKIRINSFKGNSSFAEMQIISENKNYIASILLLLFIIILSIILPLILHNKLTIDNYVFSAFGLIVFSIYPKIYTFFQKRLLNSINHYFKDIIS